MRELDNQVEYWNRIGTGKAFSHPVNFGRLTELLPTDSLILDFGCCYGRIPGLLHDYGYTNVIGVDPAHAMVNAARTRFPDISFRPHVWRLRSTEGATTTDVGLRA